MPALCCVIRETMNADCITVDCGGTERFGSGCARLAALVCGSTHECWFCSWLILWG